MSTKNKCDKTAPLLLLLKGHPGSGKSTLAKQIARHLHLSLADKDDARDCFRAAEEQYGPAGTWDLNALSYEVMFSVAASQLACQQNVVVDSPLSKVELYQKAVAVAKKVKPGADSCLHCSAQLPDVPCTQSSVAANMRIACSNCMSLQVWDGFSTMQMLL
jgi:predicted kinase